MILHVQQQGAQLGLSGDTVVARSEGRDQLVARLPLLQAVVVHGSVSLTPALIGRLLADGIDCVFLTVDGRCKGRLEGPISAAGRLRALQAIAVSRPAFRVPLARAIVRNKLRGQRRTLLALLRGTPFEGLDVFDRLSAQLPSMETMPALLGCEGFASRVYFGALRRLHGAAAGWTRTKRPARDGLNALLNYGYAVLQSRVHASVVTVGLDPHLGFLHQLGRPRPAFVLDMMEEFRAPVVEFTCWRLARELGPGDSWWSEGPDGARLTDESRRELVRRLERRFAARTWHAPSGHRVTVQRAIELQVRGFAASLQRGRSQYRPLT